MSDIFAFATIGFGLLMCVLILIQSRGASLGAGFGGSSEIHTTRRGVDKSLHQTTIIVSILFVGSIIAYVLFA